MGDEPTQLPLRISLLACSLCLLSVWYALRFVEAIRFWHTLSDYHARPGPAYIAATGGFWLLAGLALAWGLWSGKRWGWYGAIGTAAGYLLWYWSDRLVFQYPHTNWPFALAGSAIGLVIVLLILLSPKSVRFFRQRETHEH